jgi:8-oxo-dGTP pyrophosphatase MutT (NUDIX family)
VTSPRYGELSSALRPSAERVARATAFRDGKLPPVPARPSATVVLLRDGDQGLDVFMIRRRGSMAFAGGMHVFPGGGVDPADLVGRDAEAGLVFAAIRETFEECGVLLCDGSVADAAALERDRRALVEHRLTFDSVCAKHNLTPAPECLRPWAHWITPDFEPRRYDTRFFVALAPAGQTTRDVGGESDASDWVTPAKALAASARGEWLLLPPTEHTLRELAGFPNAAVAFAAAKGRDLRPWRTAIDFGADPPRFVFHRDDLA